MNIRFLKVFVCILLFAVFTVTARNAHAETHVTADSLLQGGDWSKAGSPYILDEDLWLPRGKALRVMAGTVVISGTSSSPYPNSVKGIAGDGDFIMEGTAVDPIHFLGIGGVSANGNIVLRHTTLDGPKDGLTLRKGTSTIENSIFHFGRKAISAYGSSLTIENSVIEGNSSGIWSNFLSAGPFLVDAVGPSDSHVTEFGIGGIGNALDEIDPKQNRISISNSVISGNTNFAIYNQTANTIDARNNWWGSADGPNVASDRSATGNAVYGPVDVSNWKTEDPRRDLLCCSNVLFLPGMEASRLYVDSLGFFGTSTNTLWEPNRNDDVRKLFLDGAGVGKTPGVYTKDVIDSAYTVKIYDKFIAMMNGMVADKKINSWMPFPYDWRKSVDDPELIAQLVDRVESLARSSKTGKVSIVAHSNGGLLAKELGRALESRSESGLLDRVVFVAVPQFGTPQAIAGMLHGDKQSMAGGLILSKSVARTLGLNMPGAYGLLPSAEYFKHAIVPVISSASSAGSSSLLSATAIASYDSFVKFLTGILPARNQPAESDVKTAAVLSQNLLSWANDLHSKIDSWIFPTSTHVFSIVGWGLATTNGLEYSANRVNNNKVISGDGTVLTRIADSYATSAIYLDLQKAKEISHQQFDHANILESDSVRSVVSQIVATSSETVDGVILPSDMSTTIPDGSKISYITIGVHSPVSFDVYDELGGHTGVVPNPSPDSDLEMLDNTIPNAVYHDLGGDRYITVPGDKGHTYSVQIKGTGSGNVSVTVEQQLCDKTIVSTEYTDLPVTPLLVASTTIQSMIPGVGNNATGTALLLPPIISMDFDGDGHVDATVSTSTGAAANPLLHLDSMRTIVLSMKLRPNLEKDLLTRIDRIRALIQKGKADKARHRIEKIEERINEKHWKKTALNSSDRQEILDMFDTLLAALEKDYK